MNRLGIFDNLPPEEAARRRHRELLALVEYDLDAFLEIMEECQVSSDQDSTASPSLRTQTSLAQR